jgi:hypothetical protein
MTARDLSVKKVMLPTDYSVGIFRVQSIKTSGNHLVILKESIIFSTSGKDAEYTSGSAI